MSFQCRASGCKPDDTKQFDDLGKHKLPNTGRIHTTDRPLSMTNDKQDNHRRTELALAKLARRLCSFPPQPRSENLQKLRIVDESVGRPKSQC